MGRLLFVIRVVVLTMWHHRHEFERVAYHLRRTPCWICLVPETDTEDETTGQLPILRFGPFDIPAVEAQYDLVVAGVMPLSAVKPVDLSVKKVLS